MMERLRERFEGAGYSVSKYAKKARVSPALVVKVIDGEYRVADWRRAAKYRRLMNQLKRDGVFVGRLPWEAQP
jgi:hypothetical protein